MADEYNYSKYGELRVELDNMKERHNECRCRTEKSFKGIRDDMNTIFNKLEGKLGSKLFFSIMALLIAAMTLMANFTYRGWEKASQDTAVELKTLARTTQDIQLELTALKQHTIGGTHAERTN